MANHVDCHISFSMNEDAQKKMKELLKMDDDGRWTVETFHDLLTDHAWTYEKQSELVGPKWSNIEDASEDHLSTVSAWGYPLDGIRNLMKILGEIDPQISVSASYTDEMPNFFGTTKLILDENGEPWQLYDVEYDFDDLIRYALSKEPDLKGKWDHENEEWKDQDSQDLFWELQYDFINDLQEL